MLATTKRERQALCQVLALLAKTGVIPRAAVALGNSMQTVASTLRDAVLAEIPAFSTSGNPEIIPGLDQHAGDHIQEIRRLFGGGELGDLEFVRTHAHRQAEQRFPLEATLHAYPCGHRILSHWLRDAAIATGPKSSEKVVSAVADFAIEYTNAISTIIASEYVSHTRILAESDGRVANTVYTRIKRIKELIGLDGQRYQDLTELLLATDSRRI
jgi:hypothetical protein